MKTNRLVLNAKKTNFMLLHRNNQSYDITIKLNGTEIARKNEIKYLGVTLDQKLTWKSQIDYLSKKMSKCMWAICKLRPYTNLQTLRLIYFSLAYPHLQYCVSSWGSSPKTTLRPLIAKQKFLLE